MTDLDAYITAYRAARSDEQAARDRAVLILATAPGSNNEIARALGVSAQNVSTIRKKAFAIQGDRYAAALAAGPIEPEPEESHV